MLTFFTTCKPFTGRTAVLQRNAIESWTRIGRGCDIILVGDDEGTTETAAAFGIRHAPKVERNEYGTPLLDSVFDKAQAMARHDMLCYLNADIMLMSDFMEALRRLPPERLLMISRRWNVDVEELWDFGDPEWEMRLREHARACGYQKSILGGPDFFVFRRGQWCDIPPFALGRTVFDNWLIYAAVSLDYPVIDASSCVMAIHQNHDCGHADGGWSNAWFGEEATRNRALARDGAKTYNFLDATHLMTLDGVKPAMTPEHMARRYTRRLPRWFDRRLFLANTLHELGRHDEELAVIEQAGRAAGTPDRTRRYVRARLRALLATGKTSDAEAFVARLVTSEPSPTMAYHIASICEELSAFDLAAALFRAVLADDSHDTAALKPGASYHLARIAVETSDPEAARQYAESCLAAEPKHSAARALLEALGHNGDSADDELLEAVKALQKSPARVPATSPQPTDAAD